MLNRRDFLCAGGLMTASVLTSGLRAERRQKESPQRPNILFVMTDDHAAHALSCYGSVINQTPNLDRLAEEGMRFTRCFCTNSICAPSRAVLLTGQYSHINGQIDNRRQFDGSRQTFPKLLQQAGYQTALIGKWHLGSTPTGFDYWEILPGQGSYYNPDFIQMNGTQKRYAGYCTDVITDLTIEWLDKQRDAEKPFVLMCHHKAPHRNWSPPPRHFGRYKLGTIPEPKTLFADLSSRGPASLQCEMSIRDHFYWGHDMKFHGPNLFEQHFRSGIANGEYQRMTPEQKAQWDAYYEPDNQAFIEQMKAGNLRDDDVVRWKYQRYMHDYLGTVAAVDDSIGRILDYLDKKKLAENTVVIYTSDQGFFLGDDGWYDKRFMYEPSLRMPLLVRWPGMVKPGSVRDAMVMNLDFAPTFVDVSGQSIPDTMQGESLCPLLDGRDPTHWRTAIYYHYYEYPAEHKVKRHYGIRTSRYKLIHFYYDIDAWELYDLQHDPDELHNCYEDPACAEILSRLKQQLYALQKQVGDSSELAHSFLPSKS